MHNSDKPQYTIDALMLKYHFQKPKPKSMDSMGLRQIGSTQIPNKTTGVKICGILTYKWSNLEVGVRHQNLWLFITKLKRR